jgi:hypothetical protein
MCDSESDRDKLKKKKRNGDDALRKKYGNVTQVFESFQTGLKFKELYKTDRRHPAIMKAIRIYYAEFAEREERRDRLKKQKCS